MLKELWLNLGSNRLRRFQLEIWTKLWQGTAWCYPTLTLYSTHRKQDICPTLCIRSKTHVSQNKLGGSVSENSLRNAHGNEIWLLLLSELKLLHASYTKLLKNQSEQKLAQILTILMLFLENPRLTGTMLNGNRSLLLETDGSLAWLYHCALVHSPLQTMNQCYDRIPILNGSQF